MNVDWETYCDEYLRNADFTQTELSTLYYKAANYCGTGMDKMFEVYRCKPSQYWQDIKLNANGIMKPYRKDGSGHMKNNINGELEGLFFSASLNPNGTVPQASYFGDVRFSISVGKVFDLNVVNFYFCDFYCNYQKHYVTIVVCKKGSVKDEYCNRKLKLLPTRNPFFEYYGSVLFVSKRAAVEFFYTEDVSVFDGHFDNVTPLGRGHSAPYGVKNNKQCTICNL